MRLGLVVNPLAGLGGPAGLKGSDAPDTAQIAMQRGVASQVSSRVATCLQTLHEQLGEANLPTVITVPGVMGADMCESLRIPCEVLPFEVPKPSSAEDTRAAVLALAAEKLDLLVFAGGDGTARDVFDAAPPGQVTLGIPCGVKMHSSIFANNPADAAQVIAMMARGELVSLTQAEIRDIDESAFRQGQVRSRYYGELPAPEALRYMQQVKSGGKEVEALVVEEIAADVAMNLELDRTYFVGSGSTTAAVMAHLGLENTLLGVDVIRGGELLAVDAFESQLFDYTRQGPCSMVLTVIGGQGHLFGRGNQQFSPRVIRAVGTEHIHVIATKTKLEQLPRGILVDTGDANLDAELKGYIRVVTGFEDAVLCPVN